MLCAILALIAAGCFVFMVVAILISLQLSDKLHTVERELERPETDLRRGASDSLAREIGKGDALSDSQKANAGRLDHALGADTIAALTHSPNGHAGFLSRVDTVPGYGVGLFPFLNALSTHARRFCFPGPIFPPGPGPCVIHLSS